VTALSAAVAPKADKTYVDAQDAIGIAHTDSVVASKADKTYVDAQDAIGIAHTDTAVAPKADKTYVDAQDATKANIASPTFTGTPQAPTPSAGDASTKLATTQFVATATAVQTGAPLKVQQTVDTTNRSISSTTDVATGSISSAITPQSSSNKLRVQVSGIIGASTTIGVHTKLYRSINGGTYTDITPAGMTDMQGQVVNSATFPVPFNLDFIDSPATNLPVTYQLFMSVTSAATAFLGRRGGDTVFSSPTIFTVTEIKG
jgi:hypothetical protein